MSPTAALRPCVPGCPNLSPTGRCEPHRQTKGARATRSPLDAFYDSAAWRRFRHRFLALHPLCEDCDQQGRVTPATQVDHRTPRRHGGAALDEANCRALCHSCHSRRTATEVNGWGSHV